MLFGKQTKKEVNKKNNNLEGIGTIQGKTPQNSHRTILKVRLEDAVVKKYELGTVINYNLELKKHFGLKT